MAFKETYIYLAPGPLRSAEINRRKTAFEGLKAEKGIEEPVIPIIEEKLHSNRPELWKWIEKVAVDWKKPIQFLFYDVLDLGPTPYDAMLVINELFKYRIDFYFVKQRYLDSDVVERVIYEKFKVGSPLVRNTRDIKLAKQTLLWIVEEQIKLLYGKRQQTRQRAYDKKPAKTEVASKERKENKQGFRPRQSKKRDAAIPIIEEILRIRDLPLEKQPEEWRIEPNTNAQVLKRLEAYGIRISTDTYYRYLKLIKNKKNNS